MKLNLGCGQNYLDGYVNIDHWEGCKPDLLLDIAEEGLYPIHTASITEVIAEHVLEHVGPEPEKFFRLMRELYRVMRPGAFLHIKVPHPRSDNFIASPDHVRPILPLTMQMFSRKSCLLSQERGAAVTPFALRHEVDFEIRKVTMNLMGHWARARKQGEITQEDLNTAMESAWNVINEICMTLERI